MADWIANHAILLLIAWYCFSAFVSGMPQPNAVSGLGYRWAYQSLHVLSGDLSQYLRGQRFNGGGKPYGE